MMKRNIVPALASAFFASALAAFLPQQAIAQEPLKIGLILPMSGPFAPYGRQIDSGVRLYMQLHGDTVAGRKIEIILKDDTGVAPDLTKRLAQELVVNDKVAILAGFGLTPGAYATAPVSAEAKKPMIVMNAASSAITTRSPYIVRTSHTLPQTTTPMALWAAKNGIRNVYTLVADYAPGHDAETAFRNDFLKAGGNIVGSTRVPLKNPDFSPFLQRIKDAKPDAVFTFLPPGTHTIGFMRGFVDRGLSEAGIRVIATGDLTDDDMLEAIGDAALGIISTHHYSLAHDSPENKAYVDAYNKAYPGHRANYMSVAGYDGMALIYAVLKKTGGDADGDRFVAAAKGMTIVSPRGTFRIDPETRDIIQTIYVRKVEKRDGKLYNIEFDRFPDVKDSGK